MSRIVEKRIFKLPPCRVEKDLVSEIGQILESDRLAKEYTPEYSLKSSSKDIESTKIDTFISTEWPTDINRITLHIGEYDNPKIEVCIDFKSLWNANATVAGDNPTWTDGVSRQLEKVFEKRRLGYHSIHEKRYLKALLIILTWIPMALAITYPLYPIIKPHLKEWVTSSTFFLIILLVGEALMWLPLWTVFDWLFPYFEFGNPLQKKVRKWIWGLFVSSGFLMALLFKLLDW